MRTSIGHLGYMNVLPYESVIIFWSYEYEIRSSETSYKSGYTDTNVYVVVC